MTVVVGAHHARYGRPRGAARAPHGGAWHCLSHLSARDQKRTSSAAHGVCAARKPLVTRDWGIEVPPRSSWRRAAA